MSRSAVEAILSYQQADMDGIMVLTSRQAIHEIVDERTAMLECIAELAEALESLKGNAYSVGKYCEEFCSESDFELSGLGEYHASMMITDMRKADTALTRAEQFLGEK